MHVAIYFACAFRLLLVRVTRRFACIAIRPNATRPAFAQRDGNADKPNRSGHFNAILLHIRHVSGLWCCGG